MVCVGHALAVCCRAEFGCKSSPLLHLLRICAPMATQHAFWRLGEQSCGGRLRVFMFRNCGADFARQESCQPRNIERTKRAHRCLTGQIFSKNFLAWQTIGVKLGHLHHVLCPPATHEPKEVSRIGYAPQHTLKRPPNAHPASFRHHPIFLKTTLLRANIPRE